MNIGETQKKVVSAKKPKKQSATPERKGSANLYKAGHDPRAATLVVLLQVLDEGADSQAALDKALENSSMVPTDKRLCTALVYGTLRYYLRLEWFAKRFLAKPEKLPREMYVCLLMTLYSMAFLRMPHHASVGWAVSHVQHRFGQGISKVANGFLRNVQRSLASFQSFRFYEQELHSTLAAKALWGGMPLWIAKLWQHDYGDEVTATLLFEAESQALGGLRFNRQHKGFEERRESLVSLADEGQPVIYCSVSADAEKVYITKLREELTELDEEGGSCPASSDNLEVGDSENSCCADEENTLGLRKKHKGKRDPIVIVGSCGIGFAGTMPFEGRDFERKGFASGQSMASYTTLEVLQPQKWAQPVWDACSGRGGKTLALLEMDVPVALASDPSKVRLCALPKEYARLQLSNVPLPACLLSRAEDVPALLQDGTGTYVVEGETAGKKCAVQSFGTILVDAPCSGFGTLTRRPEIKLRRSVDDIKELVAIQKDILRAVQPCIMVGGQLIYITCTINKAENEEQVAWFLQEFSGFSLEREYTTPWKNPFHEFFYAAVLKKQ